MDNKRSVKQRWAHFRFGVVGELLAAPPQRGHLQGQLTRLSQKPWSHPVTGHTVYFARPTIERWYYTALRGSDPVAALKRQPRIDSGRHRSMLNRIKDLIEQQYDDHPAWSYQLHYENLGVIVEEQEELGKLPSYSTLRRFMIAHGLSKQKRSVARLGDNSKSTRAHEVRSFEVEHVNGLWHLDFHHCSRKVLTRDGHWKVPILLAILDDHSRLICHLQWYLQETAECLVHGLIQAFIKRGLPRSLITDNGSAMIADETTQGLLRLSIVHRTTLPNSPYQNGKQEVFFAQVESRLLAMLEGTAELDLGLLNRATQAWVEMDYHRRVHKETKQTPLDRFINAPSVARDSPSLEELRSAFTAACTRTQRKSDSTITIHGTRYQIPARFRRTSKISVRLARWDKSLVLMIDERTGTVLEALYPLDKARNASISRRPIEQAATKTQPTDTGLAPLLRKQMAEYAATGMPPAYLHMNNETSEKP